ncbi:MarR family winged helix-turn-helix transcriptional regulator [Nocardia sp. NPDC050175]|uniref:MarR family winged helix-turn-helix transcriptional regulator n=1 Tax=Nocardia sp. NPDC050175 TaxID=3364317 RepID=UPI0037AD6ECA
MGKQGRDVETVGLRYLSVAYQVRRAVDGHMADNGLSLARTKILRILDQHGPVRQGSLATELGLAARSITQAVEGLERDGLVERDTDPADRRAKLVALTAAGSAALAAGTVAGERVLRQIFGSLTREQSASLDDLLGLIEDAAASARR